LFEVGLELEGCLADVVAVCRGESSGEDDGGEVWVREKLGRTCGGCGWKSSGEYPWEIDRGWDRELLGRWKDGPVEILMGSLKVEARRRRGERSGEFWGDAATGEPRAGGVVSSLLVDATVEDVLS
jgi:hypothetical protein